MFHCRYHNLLNLLQMSNLCALMLESNVFVAEHIHYLNSHSKNSGLLDLCSFIKPKDVHNRQKLITISALQTS